MTLLADALVALIGGALLWLVGTVVFDLVHLVLHKMLASRWRPLRALAWPHGVHHRWLDTELRIHPELERANLLCHLLPEYLTQLAFSVGLLLVLPAGPVAVCMALQTLAFGYLLSQRGLDINHRPIEILDAYTPMPFCPPAYHALHHVYPDAYFSAYTKLVDQLVGGAAQIAGRRYAIAGSRAALGRTLGRALERAGAAEVRSLESPDAISPGLDVLILCEPKLPRVAYIEAFVAATCTRQLPPEVWSVGREAEDATARHYARDVRVSFRVLFAPPGTPLLPTRAARRALARVRRGLHFVPLCGPLRGWAAWRRFRATPPEPPEHSPRVRSRQAAARGI